MGSEKFIPEVLPPLPEELPPLPEGAVYWGRADTFEKPRKFYGWAFSWNDPAREWTFGLWFKNSLGANEHFAAQDNDIYAPDADQ